MLVTIAEFVEFKFTPKSRPSAEVVRKWIKRGQLPYPVQRLGGRWLGPVTVKELTDRGANGVTPRSSP